MRELRKQVSKLILDSFEEKIKDVNWRNDSDFEEKIRNLIEELDDTVQEAITETSLLIDMKLEEWEADYLPSRYEMMVEDMAYRQDEIARCQR
jgi:hypothetical protein